jgi:hypothetical protein
MDHNFECAFPRNDHLNTRTAFLAGPLKTDDAGWWLSYMRPAVSIQAGEIGIWCFVHTAAILCP